MKKRFLTAVAILSAISMNLMAEDLVAVASIKFTSAPTGIANDKAIFQVNAQGKKVYFSKGNLKYQSSTNTWSFFDKQYEYISQNNTENLTPTKGQEAWMDKFKWASSNNPNSTITDPAHNGSNYVCKTTSSSPNIETDFYQNGTGTCNINNTDYDWGSNAISNGGNEAGMWRTLTKDEWNYCIQNHTNVAAEITIESNSYLGIIIAPDNYDNVIPLVQPTKDGSLLKVYSCSAERWDSLQNAGCVFLPVAGYEYLSAYNGNVSWSGNGGGGYWTSTGYETSKKYLTYTQYSSARCKLEGYYGSYIVNVFVYKMGPTSADLKDFYTEERGRWEGMSVRLVCDAN